MILKALSDLLCAVFDKLLVFPLPNFPDWAMNAFYTAQDYLFKGAGFLNALFGPQTFGYLRTLFLLSLTVHFMYHMYDLVMWVLKKIPLVSIQK